MSEKKPITYWHQLLAEMLRLMLQEHGVEVHSEPEVLTRAPRADVLLLRRETAQWTAEQLEYLPSGIRENDASHILIEFKKTESLTEQAMVKIAAYDIFYRENNAGVEVQDLLPVIVSAKHPQAATRERLGFVETEIRGVYRNINPLARRVLLLSLSKLPDTPYNAYFKLLASSKRAQEKAFQVLQRRGWQLLPIQLLVFLSALWQTIFGEQGENPMNAELSVKKMIEEESVRWLKAMLPLMPIEERLAGISSEERLAGISSEERLAGITPEERLVGVSLEDLQVLSRKITEETLRRLVQETDSAEKRIAVIINLSRADRITLLDDDHRERLLQGLDSAEQEKLSQWITTQNNTT